MNSRSQPTHARVVVIGGGIAGVSAAYQLTVAGWPDVLLVEQGHLADGTTWHSAGHCVIPYVSRQMTRFTRESIALFRALDDAGKPTGFLEMGSLTLATTADRADELRRLEGAARVEDVPYQLLGVEEAARLWPLADMSDVLLAGYSPRTGRVDPNGATRALASAARERGATILEGARVIALRRGVGDAWQVDTTLGTIGCDVVVNATGQWARDVGRLAGHQVPVVPVEHQYVLTGPMPDLAGAGVLPLLRDPDTGYYLRQEGDGALLGIYEDDVRPWAVDGVPADFLHQLLPGDIDRIAPWVHRAGQRVRSLADAGIRMVLNGPDAYTPDDRFIMGPVPGEPGMFLFAGFNSAGVQTSPGAARYLAEWIVGGEPSIDLEVYDVARFGSYVDSIPFLVDGAIETYKRHYPVRYPVEERESGRPYRSSPIHDTLAGRGAVFGERFGWERPVWFGRPGANGADHGSFGRPSWFDRVGDECRAIRDGVGIIDQTSFSKHVVSGPGATAFLDSFIATAVPAPGRLGYALVLSESGGIETDLTVSRVGENEYYLVGAAANEVRDRERVRHSMPAGGSVAIRTVTTEIGVLTIAGPRSAELLERASGASISDASHPFFSVRELVIGPVVARALRLSYTGELGWELHLPIEMLRTAYLALVEASDGLGLADVGYRALDSLGMEKSYGAVGADLDREHTPLEAGLGHLVRMDKVAFRGRDALLAQSESGVPSRRACLLLDPTDGAVPYGMEPVSRGGEVIGFTARGGYGHRIGRGLAFAYLPPEILADPSDLSIGILGRDVPVSLTTQAPYDREDRRRSIGGIHAGRQ